jgi:hypothetical protein
MSKQTLACQLADLFDCSSKELKGENIMNSLRKAEQCCGVIVY